MRDPCVPWMFALGRQVGGEVLGGPREPRPEGRWRRPRIRAARAGARCCACRRRRRCEAGLSSRRSPSRWPMQPPTAMSGRAAAGLEGLERGDLPPQALVGVLAHAARHEDDDVGLGGIVDRRHPLRAEQARDALGVVLVHLAPEGADRGRSAWPGECSTRGREELAGRTLGEARASRDVHRAERVRERRAVEVAAAGHEQPEVRCQGRVALALSAGCGPRGRPRCPRRPASTSSGISRRLRVTPGCASTERRAPHGSWRPLRRRDTSLGT